MIKAKYISTVYSKPDNGYKVLRYRAAEGENIENGRMFTASGNYLPEAESPVYVLDGQWTEQKGGNIFRVTSFQEEIGNEKADIVSYLTEAIDGCDKSIAEAIYKAFGKRTIETLDNAPERITELKSVDFNTLCRVRLSYEELRCKTAFVSWLSEHRITQDIALKVYALEGNSKARAKVEKDPYLLYEYGVKIPLIKRLAATLPLPDNYTGLARVTALEVLKQHESTGDVAMKKTAFDTEVVKALKDDQKAISLKVEAVNELIDASRIFVVNDFVYHGSTFRAENQTAKAIARLSLQKPRRMAGFDADKVITTLERKHNIALHKNQREAIKMAVTSSISCIIGGPGTGKTTIEVFIREIMEKYLKRTTVFLAPTGRAAARMKESSGYPAYTIHKHLKINDSTIFNDDVLIEENCAVVDEVSMLDIHVARKLLSAVKDGNQIILIGDINQLPSVGCGSVLQDILKSGCCPVTELTFVYRQASATSHIYINCQKIVHGNTELEVGTDFKFIETDEPEDAADKMVDLYLDAIRQYGVEEVACLCPFRKKTASGANELNRRLQEAVNPAAEGKPEIHYGAIAYRLGDRVMNRKNTESACNGDIGTIVSVDKRTSTLMVEFPFGVIPYSYNELEMLDLSYAMSIHKSQGSQFKVCIGNILPCHSVMLNMNLLNTAISRAIDRFILVGSKEAVNEAIACRDSLKRVSGLTPKIAYLKEKAAAKKTKRK